MHTLGADDEVEVFAVYLHLLVHDTRVRDFSVVVSRDLQDQIARDGHLILQSGDANLNLNLYQIKIKDFLLQTKIKIKKFDLPWWRGVRGRSVAFHRSWKES